MNKEGTATSHLEMILTHQKWACNNETTNQMRVPILLTEILCKCNKFNYLRLSRLILKENKNEKDYNLLEKMRHALLTNGFRYQEPACNCRSEYAEEQLIYF